MWYACSVFTLVFFTLAASQTIINILLAFDAYFNWYYPFRDSVPFMYDMATRERRAVDNMLYAIDMKDQFERLSINNHKSFLPHLAVYKVRGISPNSSSCSAT